MRSILILLCLASSALAQSTQPAPAPAPTKKLIEFGWDEPDTAVMRKHIAKMEQTPFDGCVFHLPGEFLWQSWGKRTFTEAEMAGAIEDLKNTPLKKFTHNFLRFNVTPGDVDWFDDFGPVIGNAKLAAKCAKIGKARGILFDIEAYNAPLFNYSKARDAGSKSWEQYAAQARQRGREVMNAFQGEYPDVVVFLTFGYSLPFAGTGADPAKLKDGEYGLLAPFLDGMFDAITGDAKIVEGFEISYGFKEPTQFDEAVTTVRQRVLSIVAADHQKYLKHVSMSFGLWMDHDWRNKAWDVNDFSKNHFTPEQFEASLSKALATADEYVWIYTESPKWWTPETGEPDKLPPAYVEAVKRAFAKAAAQQ